MENLKPINIPSSEKEASSKKKKEKESLQHFLFFLEKYELVHP